jgi:predicted amidohydrolase YtcJ
MKVRRLVGHRALALAVAACALSAAFAQSAAGARDASPPDTIFYNGKITTVDAANRTVQALAVRDGKILARGNNLAVLSLARRATQLVNLRGRRMLPGLIDGTLHGIRTGYHCHTRAVRHDVTFSRAAALAEYTRIAARVPAGLWIFTSSGSFHVNQLDQPGMFTRSELDSAAPNHPVFVQASGFSGVQTNTRGLQHLGFSAGSPGVVLDSSGQPTGQLTGSAAQAASRSVGTQLEMLTIDQQMTCLEDFIKEVNRLGLTAWDDPEGNDPFDPTGQGRPVMRDGHGHQAVNELHRQGRLNVRIAFSKNCFGPDIGLPCVLENTKSHLSKIGDDMLRFAGIGEEVMNTSGGVYPDPEYSDIVRHLACNRWGFQHHASAPTTQQRMVDQWLAVHATCPIDDLEWRMLHPGGGPDNPNDVVLSKLRSMNAGVVPTDSGIRGGTAHPPYKRIYDSGTHACAGTDALNASPFPPFPNLWYMVSGKTYLAGSPGVAPDQRLTREEALRMATSKCAWFMDLEGKIGVLAPGRYADLIVLSADYFTVPEDEIRSLTSVFTMVGGRTVYTDESAGIAPAQRCVVPRVTRTRLSTARRTLGDRGCRMGAVRRAYSSNVVAGNVIRQSRRPGTVAALNARVNLVVSRGARRAGGVAGTTAGGGGAALSGRVR